MLPWLTFDPHIMGLAINYNEMRTGTTDMKKIAEAIAYGIITPERDNDNPAASGEREDYARELKRLNPRLRLAFYVTTNGGMIADEGAYSNQPFYSRELERILKTDPNLAMRDEQGEIIFKGSGDPEHRMAVMNPGYHKPILQEKHARNMREIKLRTGGLYDDGFGDDISDKFIAFDRVVEILRTLQYGDPFSDEYFDAHVAWHGMFRQLVIAEGYGYGFNMGGGNNRINDRVARQLDVGLPMANGVPGLAMLEFFYFKKGGIRDAEHMDANMRKAVMIKDRRGRQLFICRVDPRSVQPGAQREQDMKAAVIAAQIVNGGQGTYMRWAANYDQFADVPFVREIGKLTGKPKAGTAGEPRRIREGVWERDFENMLLRIDANTNKYEMITSPIIPRPEPVREGLLQLYGASGLHLRNDHSKLSRSIKVLGNGSPVKLLPITFDNEVEELVFTNVLALVEGNWESGWLALDGPTWRSGIVPSATAL
jgi:hypothetical protein